MHVALALTLLRETAMTILPQPPKYGEKLGDPDQPEQPALVATGEATVVELPLRVLTPAAQRALAEADERRRLRDATETAPPTEVGGRGGPDPVRFGDWEKGGICWDF
jgi:hypothetical protein